MPQAPITQQITDDLRRKIEDGTYGPGALLPSEPELAGRYGVSRQTARAALQALEREGLVIVHSTRGRTVRNRPPLRRVSSTRRHASRSTRAPARRFPAGSRERSRARATRFT